MSGALPLNALDYLLALLLIGLVALGLWAGALRQLILLVSLYLGLLLAAQLDRPAALALWLVAPGARLGDLELVAFAVLLLASASVLWLVFRLAYRDLRLRREPPLDQTAGALLGLANGLLAIVLLVTLLSVLTALTWPLGEDIRLALRDAVRTAVVPGWLQAQAWPVYRAVAPWVPKGLPGFPTS